MPLLTLAVPSLAMTAACAVLFDVIPGLRSRGGLVIWFFVWPTIFLTIPIGLSHTGVGGFSAFDPPGGESFVKMIERSLPGVSSQSISLGLEVFDTPARRLLWDGFLITPGFVGARLLTFVWASLLLVGSQPPFDRFDPARQRPFSRFGRKAAPSTAKNGAGFEPAQATTVSWSQVQHDAAITPVLDGGERLWRKLILPGHHPDASAGYVTRGGELFTGLYTALWYVMMQGLPGTDSAGVGGTSLPAVSLSFIYLLACLTLTVVAALVERRRCRRSC
ncbi:MAG: hypothetical protein HYX75_18245 [Acidobacteria bacterium]|nr:hypothetical protein [Acidobacteriota bacterium]